jgi:DNA-binding MarR family transcriptional regulator
MKTSESKFAKCLYFTSNALARRTEKLAQQSWDKVGLTPSLAYLLMLVIEEPGIQPTAIAAQLQLSPSTVTRLIEKLEQKKLLVRVTEGKLTNVYPSSKGKALLPKLNECSREFYANYSKMVGKEESEKLAHNMSRIADKFHD